MRIIYASEFSEFSESSEPITPASVQLLINHARQANTHQQLTGALVFDHRAYMQCL